MSFITNVVTTKFTDDMSILSTEKVMAVSQSGKTWTCFLSALLAFTAIIALILIICNMALALSEYMGVEIEFLEKLNKFSSQNSRRVLVSVLVTACTIQTVTLSVNRKAHSVWTGKYEYTVEVGGDVTQDWLKDNFEVESFDAENNIAVIISDQDENSLVGKSEK